MPKKEHFHFKLNKPFGMLSQLHSNDVREQRNKRFLGELYNFPENSMPVGRLDEKSEGLLLMTTDGKLSDYINRAGIEKEYFAQLDGIINEEAILRLSDGVKIGLKGKEYLTKNCEVKLLKTEPTFPAPNQTLRIGCHRSNSWVSIILTEGKNRQVRKMTAAVGFPTLRLVRVRIGTIVLDSLKPGEVARIDHLSLDVV